MKFPPYIKAITTILSLSTFAASGATTEGYFLYKDFDIKTPTSGNENELLWSDFKFGNKGYKGGVDKTGTPLGPAHPDITDASDQPVHDLSSLLLTYGMSNNSKNSAEDQAANTSYNYADDNVTWQSRSVFRAQPINLIGTTFRTKFKFHIDHPKGFSGGLSSQELNSSQGADGFVFVIHTDPSNEGNSGGGIGYAGIDSRSVGIEFDTWGNYAAGGGSPEAYVDCIGPEGSRFWDGSATPTKPTGTNCGENKNEISDNHIGINVNGNPASLVLKHIEPTFNSLRTEENGDAAGQSHNWWAWIDYESLDASGQGVLKITVMPVDIDNDGVPTDSERPVDPKWNLSYEMNLRDIIGQDKAYIGFTSATGSQVNKHEILFWEFGNSFDNRTDVNEPEISTDDGNTWQTCSSITSLPLNNGESIKIRDNQYEEEDSLVGDTNGNGFIDIVSGLEPITEVSSKGMDVTLPTLSSGELGEVSVSFKKNSADNATATIKIRDVGGYNPDCDISVNIGSNFPPVANSTIDYKVDPTGNTQPSITAKIGQVLVLDGKASYDKEDGDYTGKLISFTWSSLDGLLVPNYEKAEITFDAEGTYQVSLRVTDNDGNESDEIVLTITVGNAAPIAIAKGNTQDTPTPALTINASIGEIITLDGSESHDEEDGDYTNLKTFLWGAANGVFIGQTNSSSAEISFSTVGTFTVNLLVTDSADKKSVKPATITVNIENIAPVAVAKATPNIVKAGGSVVFDGSGSSDVDGTITSYAWTLTGKGISETFTGVYPEFTFPKSTTSGTYVLSLIVTDNNNAVSLPSSVNIEITELQAPTAKIDLSAKLTSGKILDNKAATSGEYKFKINQDELVELYFSGAGSSDTDGTIEYYNWSGDIQSVGQEVYLNSGKLTEDTHYIVTLTVTDNDGYTDEVELDITIVINLAPIPIIPVITILPGTDDTVIDDQVFMEKGNTILLDASRSNDPDAQAGEKLKYEWYKEGNPETKLSTSPTYEHKAEKGSEKLVLKLTDEDGATSTTIFTVQTYEPSYSASGSMSCYFFALLSLMVLVRRKLSLIR